MGTARAIPIVTINPDASSTAGGAGANRRG
jgi:hypothetical protein